MNIAVKHSILCHLDLILSKLHEELQASAITEKNLLCTLQAIDEVEESILLFTQAFPDGV